MYTKKLFAIILSVVFILSTFAGCRKLNGEMSSGNTSDISSTAYSIVDIVENESSDIESTDGASSDNQNTVSSSDSGNTVTSSDGGVESTVTSVVEPTITVNPDGDEIYGEGSEATPYEDTPNADNQTVTTVSIPAGKSVFYNIYRVGGRILTINSSNVYVVCDGTKYTAQNGVLSFKVVDALASDAVAFEIGNTGTSATTFSIKFTDVKGSFENPEKVDKIGNKITTSLKEGDEVGYYYEYVAEQSGELHIYLNETTDTAKDFALMVQNNKDGSGNTATVQMTNDDDLTSTDDENYEIKLDVEKGDIIRIHLAVVKSGRKYPATVVEWYGKIN